MTRLLPKPIIHGRDHACGGADPIPGICVLTGPVTNAIPGLVPGSYYRLNESSGDWIDSAGSRDLTYVSRTGTVRGVDSGLDEADGALCVTAIGPDPTTTGTQSEIGNLDDDYFKFLGSQSFSVTIRIRSDWDFPVVYPLGICGTLHFAGTDWNGWALRLEESQRPAVIRMGSSGSGGELSVIAAANSYTSGTWMRLTATFDGSDGTLTLYGDNVVLGTEVDASPPALVTGSTHTLTLGGAGGGGADWGPSFQRWSPWKGELDSFALWDRALSAGEVGAIAAGDAGGGGGSVIGVDDEGNVGWVEPKIGVNVNGAPPSGAAPPGTPAPSDPDDSFATAQWIVDQPFLYGGGSFEAPSHKWTTIPFTTPAMNRWSNVTGEGTRMTELDWDDPAAAGWVDPSSEYSSRAIVVPHDLRLDEFGQLYNWMQVCLRLEYPMVKPQNSYRGLRIFETTRQKHILEAIGLRALCAQEGGRTDVQRDLDVAWTGAGRTLGIFADGDVGGLDTDNHDAIQLVPNAGYAFYLDGLQWLPKDSSGEPVLKRGMRLIAQVYQDSGQTLTFHCDSVSPHKYRPHFVIWWKCERDWGSPWSDWPLYAP